MAFADFLALQDSYKVWKIEINAGEDIEDYTWTQDGNAWWTSYTTGSPNKVTEDDVTYVERFTLTECKATAESFYYDHVNQKLYLHTVGTDDPGTETVPGTYDYKIVAFCWQYFTNTQFEDQPVIYPRIESAIEDGSFEIWDSATALNKWSKSEAGTSVIGREDTEVDHGGYSVKMEVDGSNSYVTVYQSVQLQPTGKCKISIRYKMSEAVKTASIRVYSGSDVWLDSNGVWQTGVTNITLANSTEWTTYELEFYAHADYTNYVFAILRGTSTSSTLYFDNCKLDRYREDNYYLPLIKSADMPNIEQSVGDYHVGDVRMSFGQLRFLNDGYWYSKIQNLLWHNKDTIIKYGEKGDAVENFGKVFTGQIRKPEVGDGYCKFTLIDGKVLAYKQIPATKYWVANYPDIETGTEGLPIPIIYGEFENIFPVMTDTTTFTYTVAVHELENIPDVYKDGEALTIAVDYTLDLANGAFTLLADPGDALISCDVKGKKCDIEDGTYSTNVADIIYDIMISYLDVDKGNIDYESFLDLKGSRTQDHHLYLEIAQSSTEVIRRLQGSALFHLIPTIDGKFGAFRYKTGVTGNTPRMTDESYKKFILQYDTTGVYSKVRIRYNRNPGDAKYDTVIREDANTIRRYGIDETFVLTSTLKIEADAENIGDYYMDLLKDPQRKVRVELPTEIFDMRPAEKVIFNKTRTDRDGNIEDILSEEPYRVLTLKKSLKTGRVSVIALEDLQSAGETFCEVCYTCQSCNASQQGITGSCTACFACEKCDAGQCTSCELCYYCEYCDSGQCDSCESCDICEICDSGQCSACMVCDICEKCDAGQCDSCQTCDICQKCDSGECTVCMSCDSCEQCNTCDLAECSACNTCEKCNTCQNSQCTTCEVCNVCQTCDACLNSECTSCEVCVACQQCDSAECATCETCDVCQSCDACQKCVSFEYGNCTNCITCEVCDTCQESECDSCQQCDSCLFCVACQKCNTGECTQCMLCDTCETHDACYLCVACEKCDGGGCQVCVECEGSFF